MCGVAGEIRFDSAGPDLMAVGRMSARMQARGPDGSGLLQHGPVALAHRRLTIIDLSPAGEQPMVDAELGLSLVFNGCIYNYRELRNGLEGYGYRFFSTSDTEVILKAYHKWGAACVERFAGMFAFVIVERGSGRVVMARDRLGIKPLYLSRVGQRLRFASTLPALVAAGDVDTSIDPEALHHYLTFHSVVPSPATILAGVRKLPPATVRTIERDGTEVDRVYWRPSFTRDPEAAARSDDEWEEAVLEKLRVAVDRRLVADVPVGVLLSGGLDSSVLVALVAERARAVETFSIGFQPAGGMSGDEFAYSDVVARAFDTHHHQIRIADGELFAAVRGAIGAMSEPMVSHDAVAFYLLSEQVAKHVKVVQSGQGADEIFAGYEWYPPLAAVARERAVEAYTAAFCDRDRQDLERIVEASHLPRTDVSRQLVADHFAAPGAETALDAALRLDATVMLVDDPVKRVDNMTMAWGLEGRVPFLDHELVELAAACPPRLKLAQGGKGVLKSVARKLIPAAVIDRPKGYFPVPGIRHLQGELLDLVRDALEDTGARTRGLFRRDTLRAALATPNARSNLGVNTVWQLGLLELWLRGL